MFFREKCFEKVVCEFDELSDRYPFRFPKNYQEKSAVSCEDFAETHLCKLRVIRYIPCVFIVNKFSCRDVGLAQ